MTSNQMIYNCDCFPFMKEMVKNNFKVDCILTDIPYQISMENNFKTMKDRTGRNGIDFGEWDKEFDCSSLSIFGKLLNPNGSVVLFHSFEQYGDVKKALESAGLECKDRIIWRKTNPMPRNRDRRYISNCEMGSWYVMKKAKWTFNRQNEKYQEMIFNYPSESGGGFKRYHPTQKNLEMVKELVSIHTNEGDIVFDPFAGSGTTGLACKLLGRNFIGCEVDENYTNIAKERIENV